MARSAGTAAVHKFGGAGLADAGAIRHAAQIVAAQPSGVVVVASAMRGVTDALLDIATLASRGELPVARTAIDALRKRHVAAATELATDNGLPSTADINR